MLHGSLGNSVANWLRNVDDVNIDERHQTFQMKENGCGSVGSSNKTILFLLTQNVAKLYVS